MQRILDEKGKELSFRDCLAYAHCYKNYSNVEDYIDALEYEDDRKLGIKSFLIAKKISRLLSQVMSFEDIQSISLLFDIDENKKRTQ